VLDQWDVSLIVDAYYVLRQVNMSDFWFVSFTFTMGTDDTVLTCPPHF